MTDSSTIKKLEELSVHCKDDNIENKENNNDNINNNNNNISQKTKSHAVSLLKGNIQQVKKKKVFARLHLFNRDGSVKQIVEMRKYKFIIGSDQKSTDILITRPGVYSNHAEIIYDKEVKKFYLNPLVDPNISDTIRINFIPFINKKEVLGNNDIISIGLRAFRIEFFAPVYVDNLILPSKNTLQQKQQQQQQQQQQQPPPTQKKFKEEIQHILTASTPATKPKQKVNSTSTTVASSSSSLSSSSSSSSSSNIPKASSKKQTPIEQPSKPTSKKSSQSKPSSTTASKSSINKSSIDGDNRSESDKVLQKLKTPKVESNDKLKNIINKPKKSNKYDDDENDGDNEESDYEEEDEKDQEGETESESEKEEDEEELVPNNPNSQPQNKSASSTIKSVSSSSSSSSKPTAATKPTTATKSTIAAKSNPIVNKKTTSTTVTKTTKNANAETKQEIKITQSTITTTTTKQKTMEEIEKEKPLRDIKKKITKFVSEFEKEINDIDFIKLDKTKRNIKKSLDFISQTKYEFQGEDSKTSYIVPLGTEFQNIPFKNMNANFILDYYSKIHEPVSITSILNKLKSVQNYGLDQVLEDFEQMLTNVRLFHTKRNEYWWIIHHCNIQFYKSLYETGLVNQDEAQAQIERSSTEIEKLKKVLNIVPKLIDSNKKEIEEKDNNEVKTNQNQSENEIDDQSDSDDEGKQKVLDDGVNENPDSDEDDAEDEDGSGEYEDEDDTKNKTKFEDEEEDGTKNKINSDDSDVEVVFKQGDEESDEERDQIEEED
ncbi:hypothetical protein ACTFIU_005058 [Dictyostelium citrinum]